VSIDQLIGNYYKKLEEPEFRVEPTLGQICWVPILNLNPIPKILEVERAKPEVHTELKYVLNEMNDGHFKTGRNRLPLKLLDLGETEEFIAMTAKKRPAIIVSDKSVIFGDIKSRIMKRAHLQEENIVVVPLYSSETEFHEGGFPQIIVARTKAMLYPQFFYCPPDKLSTFSESIARLDRLTIVRPIRPTYSPTPIALKDEPLSVILSMIQEYFGAPENEKLSFIKEMCLETLPADARPAGYPVKADP